MSARLFCKTGAFKGTLFDFADGATVGRAPSSDVVLEAPSISASHARIWWEEEQGSYLIEDQNSTNGTQVDGVGIDGVERLGDLNVITFSTDIDFIFQLLQQPTRDQKERKDATLAENEAIVLPPRLNEAEIDDGTGAAKDRIDPDHTSVEAELPPLPPSLRAEQEVDAEQTGFDAQVVAVPPALLEKEDPQPRFFLEVLKRDEPHPTIALREGANRVGRSRRADVRLDSEEVSRSHATITVTSGRVSIRDEGSSNHTYLEGVRVDGEADVPIGSELAFGKLRTRLRDDDQTS